MLMRSKTKRQVRGRSHLSHCHPSFPLIVISSPYPVSCFSLLIQYQSPQVFSFPIFRDVFSLSLSTCMCVLFCLHCLFFLDFASPILFSSRFAHFWTLLLTIRMRKGLSAAMATHVVPLPVHQSCQSFPLLPILSLSLVLLLLILFTPIQSPIIQSLLLWTTRIMYPIHGRL